MTQPKQVKRLLFDASESNRRWFIADAWYEGVEARRCGRNVTECPYHGSSHRNKSWCNGWTCAEILTRRNVTDEQAAELPRCI